MKHTKGTIEIYLKSFDSLEYKIKHLYDAEKEILNRIKINPLRDDLNSDEKYLLDYVQAKIKALKKELEETEGLHVLWDSKNTKASFIKDIADSISSKGSSNWDKEVIEAFLRTYNNNKNLSVEKARKLAIENANSDKVKEDLAKVNGSTLDTWKNKL